MFALWLMLSGHYTVLLTVLGALSAVGVSVIAHRMKALDAEGLPMTVLLRLPLVSLWLIKEILKSNLAVIRVILDPDTAQPVMANVKANQKTTVGLAAHANFITLTPGTVSVNVNETRNTISVHCLTFELADGLKDDTMDRQVSRLEGKSA